MPCCLAHEELSPQISPEILTALHKSAEFDGLTIQAIFNESLRNYIEHKEKGLFIIQLPLF